MTVDFDALFIKAGTIFTPAQPIDRRDIFAGRIAELARVVDAIYANGQHVIIFGERGVGKTSIANILDETIKTVGGKDFIVSKVNCDSTDTFASVWRKSLKNVVYIAETPSIGYSPTTKQIVMDLTQGLEGKLVPEEICTVCKKSNIPLVFVFDEFDRMRDGNSNLLFADTIKSLSDYRLNGTLILVGVADNVEELINNHQSIARSLDQIRIPRMDRNELSEIINKRLEVLGMTIQPDAAEMILILSQGLPHYTHRLGLEASRVALFRKSAEIEHEDVRTAIAKAIETAQATSVAAYQRATSSAYKEALYKEVLLACALAHGDDLGYFAAGDVRTPLSTIMQKRYEIPSFSGHLHAFCSPERGSILSRTGSPRMYRYRFNDPIMRPFIVMKGLIDEKITDKILNAIPIWKP